MNEILSYSMNDFVNIYKNNKDTLESFFYNKSIENYTETGDKIIQTEITILILILLIALISIILWIWALVITIIRWNKLDKYRKVICIIFLILTWSHVPILSPFLSPIIVLATVYSNKK